MNINMLRDSDDDPGFYAAACAVDPKATNWKGCSVYASVDAGATYSLAFSITAETTMGVATNALANFQGGNIPDELSHVNVRLLHGSLSSTNNAGLLSGVNMAVIGDEILYFRDATLQSDGTYTLRGFLRGRRGSEYAMSEHLAGDRFVLVDPATMVRVTQSSSDIGVAKTYKAVTNGMTLGTAEAKVFTNEGAGIKPYAPVHLGGGRDSANNLTLSWVRRTRTSGEWRDATDVPLGEEAEAYEVEILSGPGGAVLRTIDGLTSATATYSASDQTADFGAPQPTIYFRVYQLSSVIGRGRPANGSI